MANENSDKMGKFICELRKLKGFTQKDLAEKLNVTDKAVSKWERGLSCPDISLLVPLAKILEVSTSELLVGEKKPISSQDVAETVINEALQYSNKNTIFKIEKIKQNFLGGLSIIFLIAILTCAICDYFITGNLTWSLIVIISLISSWLLLLPFFKSKRKAVKNSLIILSIIHIPYLGILSKILDLPLIFSLGVCISIGSVIGLWCLYGVFRKYYNRKWYAMGITFLITIPLSLGITHISAFFIKDLYTDSSSDILQIIISFVLSAICFGVDYFMVHSKNNALFR